MAKNLLHSVIRSTNRTPGLVNTHDIIEKIESGYLADNRNGYRQKKSFSPSTLVYQFGSCARYWFLAFHGAEFIEENTPYQVANMRSGTLGHERIQKAMEDAGIMISKEEPIRYSNPPIFGYQDAELLINDAPLPIEIKTTNDASFMRRKEAGTALNYHIAQLAIYMYVRDKDMGAILYENKNTHELLMIPVEMDERIKSWVEQMLEWCRTVKAASDANTIPKKTYRSNSKICKSCPVKDACMNADIGEIIINPLEQLA